MSFGHSPSGTPEDFTAFVDSIQCAWLPQLRALGTLLCFCDDSLSVKDCQDLSAVLSHLEEDLAHHTELQFEQWQQSQGHV